MTEPIVNHEESDTINDVADHAVTLLDCADDLSAAIEENYRAAERFRRRYESGEPADPREVLMAFGGLKAMLRQAMNKLESQEDCLERLGFAVVTRPQPSKSGRAFRLYDLDSEE
ncbi:MAG: hypothetical protein H6740_04355 [Alphaproteobacteria bacterium]|nr:hypothetical protein [Alphaproteobacteria bacterium]